MTFRGAIRSYQAASRRVERENIRRAKNAERNAKLHSKLVAQEMARLEVEDFQEKMERLVSVHKECGEDFDWVEISQSNPPVPPERFSTEESLAVGQLKIYKPSIVEKMLGQVEAKQQELQGAITVAQHIDEAAYQKSYQAYLEKHEEWAQLRQLAELILQGNTQAYLDAIEDLQPFAEIQEIGCRMNFVVHSPHLIEAAVTVNGDHVVPSEIKSLTALGKVSTKKMPRAKFLEIYQDYVCGCALRIGREFMAVLPVEMVLVNAHAEMLNPATGHLGVTPVLGVAMQQQTLQRLNFDLIDPSDAMRNFIHRMGFQRSAGFSAIEPILIGEIVSSGDDCPR